MTTVEIGSRLRGSRPWTTVAALVASLALAGCGGVQVKAEDHVPTPLVDELPLRVGVTSSMPAGAGAAVCPGGTGSTFSPATSFLIVAWSPNSVANFAPASRIARSVAIISGFSLESPPPAELP